MSAPTQTQRTAHPSPRLLVVFVEADGLFPVTSGGRPVAKGSGLRSAHEQARAKPFQKLEGGREREKSTFFPCTLIGQQERQEPHLDWL